MLTVLTMLESVLFAIVCKLPFKVAMYCHDPYRIVLYLVT